MIMDLATEHQIHQIRDSSHLQIKQNAEIQTKVPIKRSFDVAFLMLPDEKLKQKEKLLSRSAEVSSQYPLTELTVRSDLMNRQKIGNKVFINGEYSAVFKTSEDRYSSGSLNSTASSEKSDDTVESELPRSAFSKVTQIINVDSPNPPAAISPDQLSCSSASPPISYSPPSNHTFRSEYSPFINSSAFQAINQPSYSPQKQQKSLIYRGNSLPVANNNAGEQGYLHAFQQFQANSAFMAQPEQFIRNPAAAILNTLLPTSIGALSLPAQNVCAKCNISFRMTSDLVYHMRSHHKNENIHDPQRRKREEKLKCPVCSESFRERHHLTRHMTAHQDKEGDLLDHEIAEYHSRRK